MFLNVLRLVRVIAVEGFRSHLTAMRARARVYGTGSKTKALALRPQERRRRCRNFCNETHSAVSFPVPEHCANPLPSGI